MATTKTRKTTKLSSEGLAQQAYGEAWHAKTGRYPDAMSVQDARRWCHEKHTTLSKLDAEVQGDAVAIMKAAMRAG